MICSPFFYAEKFLFFIIKRFCLTCKLLIYSVKLSTYNDKRWNAIGKSNNTIGKESNSIVRPLIDSDKKFTYIELFLTAIGSLLSNSDSLFTCIDKELT